MQRVVGSRKLIARGGGGGGNIKNIYGNLNELGAGGYVINAD